MLVRKERAISDGSSMIPHLHFFDDVKGGEDWIFEEKFKSRGSTFLGGAHF